MAVPQLGKLERVDLRDIWKTEAQEFTPWLAQEGNLKLLGDTIGVELELEAQEKEVGPFRADILCKDTADGSWVLIENQLEQTDHTHLGQILTYAAGLNAVTIVWIARRFTDEHRATLDWLNEQTGEEISFFALEVELWQIGDSAVAPKFNVVASPNEWTKGGGTVRKSGDLSPAKQLQKEYWTAFRHHVLSQKTVIKPTKALPQHWMNIALGTGRAYMYVFCDTRESNPRIGTRLVLQGDDRLAHFHLLHDEKAEIEGEVEEELTWQALPDKKTSYVNLYRLGISPWDKPNWPTQHAQLLNDLEKFHQAFSARIKNLDAGDYHSEDGDDVAEGEED